MTQVKPFRALRYDPARVDLARVIVPPYDVIADDERESFYDRDPHNAIRLELTRDVAEQADTDYAEVPRTLAAWREAGVLVRDAAPAFYGLRQGFTAPDGTRHLREGFFALLHLEDYEHRVVLPHERTLAGPKADRLKMLRAARANLSSVFLLYEDRDQALQAVLSKALEALPVGACVDETGAELALIRIDDPGSVDAICRFLADRPSVIADGHHRYETALAYRDEQRSAGAGEDAPSEWMVAYFANAYAPGSLLLPIHRLIKQGSPPSDAVWSERLPGWRQRRVEVATAGAIPALLGEHLSPHSHQHAFAADDASGVLRIFWKEEPSEELSVRAIHREVIGGVFGLDEEAVRGGAIEYPKSALRTATDLRAGRGAVALYLNALSPDDVFRVTGAGEVMPQKSTFFYPKLPTGLVFRTFEDGR